MKNRSKTRLLLKGKIGLWEKTLLSISILMVFILLYLFFSGGDVNEAMAASKAQSKDEYSGNWQIGSSWQDGIIPSTTDEYVINGTITRNGTFLLKDLQTLIVNNGDTLIINGNLDLADKASLMVMPEAILIVRGSYRNNPQTNDIVQAGGSLMIFGGISLYGSSDIMTAPGANVTYDSQINPTVEAKIKGGCSFIYL